MSNNNDINFYSGDIKKKDIGFNVEETKSKKFINSVSNFKTKVLSSPPLKGKNKFITLGVATLVIILAIFLPIIIPRIFKPSEPSLEQQAEEEEMRRQRREDAIAVFNNLDPDASEETKNAILSDLEAKIEDSATDEEARFFMSGKAFVLSEFEDFQDAIESLRVLIDKYREAKLFTDLARSYTWASHLYEDAGDVAQALEYAKGALAVVDEAASDPEKPQTIAGREHYQSRVNALEGKQQ